MLKWTGALAAAGIVGIGLGFGGDLLIRPSTTSTLTKTQATTQTATQTATTTVTTTSLQTPVPLSYVPPLSPSVQTRVNQIIQDMVNSHASDTSTYQEINSACGSGAVKVSVNNGVVVRVAPEDIVNPTIAREDAYLPADALWSGNIRGIPWGNNWTYYSQIQAPTRLLYPMKRTGPRGDPANANFVRITWDEAIATVVNQIQLCKTKYGNYSVETGGVCYSHNEPYLIDYGVECSGGWGCSSMANNMFATAEVYGNPYAGSGASPTDLYNSKLIIFWAQDITAGGHITYKGYLLFLALAKEKGIPIIVIDPRYTDAAETWADQWIPIRPGTDMAMMLAVANVMFKENLYDADYVSQFVEPTGFQKWKDYVLGNAPGYDGSDGKTSPDGAIDRTPEWAAPICGVPAATIRAFAELYANSKPTCLIFGTGGGRQTRGMNQARASMYLQAMTGNVGVLGGSQGGDAVNMYGYLNAYSLPAMPGVYGIEDGGWPSSTQPALHSEVGDVAAILLRDDYQNGTITKDEYYRAIGNNINNPAPNIHMIYRLESGHTPGPTMANINRALQAVKAVDFFVTGAHHMDGWYSAADIVLPMQENYEMSSFFTDTERGIMYCKQILASPGEVRDMNWFRMQVANGLGVGTNFANNYLIGLQNTTYDQWNAGVEAWLSQSYPAWATSSAIAPVLAITGVPTWDQLQTNGLIRSYLVNPQPVGAAASITAGKQFINFYDPNLETFDSSKIYGAGWYGLGAPVAPMAIWQPPEETLVDPRAAIYPLVMRDTHARYSSSGSTGWADPMLQEVYRHSIWMNPADAAARGIVDGAKVEVFNDRGVISVPAYVTSRQTPGSVFVHAHMAFQPDRNGVCQAGCSNVLNSDSILIAAGGQEATNALVDVRLASTSFVATATTLAANSTNSTSS
jgi:anaerobic dimethyl sulfoxide reductase subunit A